MSRRFINGGVFQTCVMGVILGITTMNVNGARIIEHMF